MLQTSSQLDRLAAEGFRLLSVDLAQEHGVARSCFLPKKFILSPEIVLALLLVQLPIFLVCQPLNNVLLFFTPRPFNSHHCSQNAAFLSCMSVDQLLGGEGEGSHFLYKIPKTSAASAPTLNSSLQAFTAGTIFKILQKGQVILSECCCSYIRTSWEA